MNDSTESIHPPAPRSESLSGIRRSTWLLLVHHIPPQPAYFRVKVRRRLRRVGAVALKPSVYVLPRTADTEEDMQWIRRMIQDEGGEATLCEAGLIGGTSDAEVESMFRAQSGAGYGEIIEVAHGCSADPSESDVRRLRRRLEREMARDFFAAPGRAEAERCVGELRATVEARGGKEQGEGRAGERETPRGATWVTRTGVHVDRIASAWLIRRFIDAGARFRFVDAKGYGPEPGEIRFDMYEGEYTHEGDACTFEVLVRRFVPGDPALSDIAEIVHDIDCKDEKFGREEAAGVASLIRGLVASNGDDGARIQAGTAVFDGLYAAFERPGE